MVRPLCLGTVGIGAGEQNAVVGIMRARGPDLLAVDDPVVALLLRARAQARDVGAAGGLGEQLAPDFFAGGQRRQIGALMLLARERHHGRPAHAVADDEHARLACRTAPLPAARSRARSARRRGRHIPSASAGRPSRHRPSSSARLLRRRGCWRSSAGCGRARICAVRPHIASARSPRSRRLASARNSASCGVSSKFMVSILGRVPVSIRS